jgi:hypothetical protein
MEFDRWGEISGASLNKDKTKILKIGCQNESSKVKILGIVFNKFGVSKSNLTKVKENIIKAVNIWNTVKLNMLERVAVFKTFLLSKLYFVANFTTLSNEYIRCPKFYFVQFHME